MSSRCSRAHDAHAARPPPRPRDVHGALTGAYIHWCRKLGLAPRTATSALHSEGGARVKGTPCATQIVEESVLYLCVWAEAANLRHMPELLCWLLHSLLGGRSAWTLGAVGGGSSLCASLLDDVIQPIYRVAAERMKAPSRLTYDDLNELFWSSRCSCTALVGGSGGGGLKPTWVGHAWQHARDPRRAIVAAPGADLPASVAILLFAASRRYCCGSASSRSSLALCPRARLLRSTFARTAGASIFGRTVRSRCRASTACVWPPATTPTPVVVAAPPATLLLSARLARGSCCMRQSWGCSGCSPSPRDCDSLPDGSPARPTRPPDHACCAGVPPSGLSPEARRVAPAVAAF